MSYLYMGKAFLPSEFYVQPGQYYHRGFDSAQQWGVIFAGWYRRRQDVES